MGGVDGGAETSEVQVDRIVLRQEFVSLKYNSVRNLSYKNPRDVSFFQYPGTFCTRQNNLVQ